MLTDKGAARVHFRPFLEIMHIHFSFVYAFSSVIAVKMAGFPENSGPMCAYGLSHP